jgi:hypothetical protein
MMIQHLDLNVRHFKDLTAPNIYSETYNLIEKDEEGYFININQIVDLHKKLVPGITIPKPVNMLIQPFLALCWWRLNKNCFSINKELYEMLFDSEFSLPIPDTVLGKLPYLSIAISLPYPIFYNDKDFGKHHEVNVNNLFEIHGFLLTNTRTFFANGKREIHNWLVTAIGVSHFTGETESDFPGYWANIGSSWLLNNGATEPKFDNVLKTAINLGIYVTSYMQGIQKENPNKILHQNKREHTKFGWKWLPKPTVTLWEVGEPLEIKNTFSKIMDDSKGNGTHASPSPHIRRAHWHTYLTGPKKNISIEDRKRKLIWIPPLPIAMPRETQEEV